MRELQTQEILNLHGPDGNADPGGKPQRHRKRNVLNQSAKTCQPKQNQKHAGHQRGNQ
ncbi:hypothetical protein D3C71_1931450 [compost metagenome]